MRVFKTNGTQQGNVVVISVPCGIHAREEPGENIKCKHLALMVDRAGLHNISRIEEHKPIARERNAVESIPSLFRRKYSIDYI